MVQSKRLVNTLKETLKSRDITYAEVAGHLGLSLSSVKRQFSTQRFSLHRLEQVCDLAGIDLLELARLAEERRLRVAALTEEQERHLVSDPALLLTTVCVLNRWTFERIVERYGFTTVQLTNLLVRLDRIGLIELLPAKRIRLRVARNFAWLPGGPIHRYFVDRVQGEFLSGEFDPDRDLHRFSWGMLSDPSAAQLRAKIAEVMDAFDDLTRRDEVRADTAAGTCFLVALRRWEPTAFRSFRHSNLADAG
ncbi:MAG: helix-turn-helix domain-containing protein [Gammaproteobacteria bacterium]|nr:helix-turn-helix domain-containing protein [Gammaproteobacteria bacterium]MDE0413547.1 helix-turn-helix domain-containing protein [Gammaproteobacteria bacterium]